MNSLKLTTAQAINTVPVSRAIADYLSQQMDIPVEFVGGTRWQERYRLLDEGQIHVGWVLRLMGRSLPEALCRKAAPEPLAQ